MAFGPTHERATVTLGGRRFEVELVQWASLRGGHDRVLVEDDFLGIADGATPLRPDWPDPGRFAAGALAELAASSRRQADVGRYWADAIRSLAHRAAATEPTVSCAVAVVRSRSTTIEVALLGDCTVLLGGRDGSVTRLSDDRLRQLDQAADRQLNPDERSARLLHNRSRMNQASGYWIFAADPAAAAHVRQVRQPAADLDSILLYTDGLDLASRELGIAPPGSELHDIFSSATLGSAARALREVRDRLWRVTPDLRRRLDDVAWIHAQRAS